MYSRLRTLFPKFVGLLAHLPRTWGLVWRAARGWTLALLGLLLLQGVLPALSAYLTKQIVDCLVNRAALNVTATYGALFGGVLLLAELLRSLTGLVRAQQAELLQDSLSDLIQRQSVAVDYAFYELPDYFDHLHRARGEATYRPQQLLETIGSLLQDGVTLIALFVVLAPFGWWLPLALLAATLPSLFVVLRSTLRQYEWRRNATEAQRRAQYYDWVLTASETAAEVRLFGLGDHFRAAYGAVRARLREEKLSLARAQTAASLWASMLALALTGAAFGWMGWRALQGAITLGVMALFYQAFNQGHQSLRALLGHLGALYENALFLGDLFAFLDLKPQLVAPDSPAIPPSQLREALRFEGVSFRYSGNETAEGEDGRYAIRDFDLTIRAGETIALVGLNGAGKSTLIKLLCRFHDPVAGRISLDGRDLREFDPVELRKRFTVLFQKPVEYQMTVAENIALGSIRRDGDPESLRPSIAAAAAAATVTEIAARLPHGLDTQLGKWFAEGAELSVGEWQRVALARAFLRDAPIVLMDEPTSAMDAWTEAVWLRHLRNTLAGRTVLLITHRFTTAIHADRICVMDGGRIIEAGTHRELLARGGRYAAAWAEQTSGLPQESRPRLNHNTEH